LVSPVSISHGDLAIQVGGSNAKDPGTRQGIVEMAGTTVASLIKSLNAMGVKPEDLVSILQSLKVAGALKADLRVM
jgi:flagellar P-ring protein precursor FlgI